MIYFYSLIALILAHFAAQLYSSSRHSWKISVVRDVIGVAKNGMFLWLIWSILHHLEANQDQLYQLIQMILRSV